MTLIVRKISLFFHVSLSWSEAPKTSLVLVIYPLAISLMISIVQHI